MIILQAALAAAIYFPVFVVFILITLVIVALIAYAILTRKGTKGMDKKTKNRIVWKSILIALSIGVVLFIFMIVWLNAELKFS
jgi:Na+-driven multidrug efflux pump